MASSKLTSATRAFGVILVVSAIGAALAPSAQAHEAPAHALRMDRYDPVSPEPGVAVMAIHGGGWWSGGPQSVQGICEAVVASLNATCFAPAYTLSGVAPFPAANDDLVSAVASIRSLGFTHVGAVGLSAGGNLAAWLASRNLVDVAAVWSAPTDLRSLKDWNPRAHGGTVGVIRSFAPTRSDRRRASPVATGVAVPLLVATSEREMIPLSQAFELYDAATGPRHLTIFTGSAHAAQYSDLELPETLDWLAAYL